MSAPRLGNSADEQRLSPSVSPLRKAYEALMAIPGGIARGINNAALVILLTAAPSAFANENPPVVDTNGAAAAAGAPAPSDPTPNPEKPPYVPSGYARLGVQAVSTTTSSSETSNSLQVSVNLPKGDAPDWVDSPSVQATVATVNQNGVDLQVQGSAGLTWNPAAWFRASLTASLGVDNYFTGLDSRVTRDYDPAGYAAMTATPTFVVPTGKGALEFSSINGVKTYFKDLEFDSDGGSPRSQIQVWVGGQVAYVIDGWSLGMNVAYYPLDRLATEGGAPVWGDAFVSKSF